MNTFIEAILAFAATMLVLALAAQALQEAVKNSFAIKSWTRLKALRRLVVEAARTACLSTGDGEDILTQVTERLHNLSQNGLRGASVRLDALTKSELVDLIKSVDPARVGALKPLGNEEGKQRLVDVAKAAETWFDLSQQPVADRYRRRMQLGALAAGLVVVLLVNADAISLVRRVREDPAFRARMVTVAAASWTADSSYRILVDSAVVLASDTATARQVASLTPALNRARARRDSVVQAALSSDTVAFLGYPSGFRISWRWAFGIVISTLLVGLGAPFWHDLLESIFGLKNRIRFGGKAPSGEQQPT